MSGKQLTSDDLLKFAAAFSAVGYGLALLALEKADLEKAANDPEPLTAALNRLLKQSPVPIGRIPGSLVSGQPQFSAGKQGKRP